MMWYTGCNFTSDASNCVAPAAGLEHGSLGCGAEETHMAAKANADLANKPAVGAFLTLPVSFFSGLQSVQPE